MPKIKKQSETKPESNLIKMQREDGKSADVHPDMVDDYRKGGYEVVK